MAAALARLGTAIHEPSYLQEELSWQSDIRGDPAGQKGLLDELLGAEGVKAMAFVTEGDGTQLTVVHSLTRISRMTPGIPKKLKGKTPRAVGFVGDRTATTMPTLVEPQTRKAWAWQSVEAADDGVKFAAFYDDEDNHGELWGPDNESSTKTFTLPQGLLIPQRYVAKGVEGMTTHDLYAALAEDIGCKHPPFTVEQAKLAMEWCMVASQPDRHGNSVLAIDMGAIINNNKDFLRWQEHRLDATLGPRPAPRSTPPRSAGVPSPQQLQGLLEGATRVASTAATSAAMKAVKGNGAADGGDEGGSRGGRTTARGGRSKPRYTPNEIAKLCALSGVASGDQLSPIWFDFEETSDVDEWRAIIWKRMLKWMKAHPGRIIDRGIFFLAKWLEDFVALKFNPGGPSPSYTSAEKGVTPQVMMPFTAEEVEAIRSMEAAADVSRPNWSFNDAEKWGKMDARPPPHDFFSFQLYITSFAAFLWAAFTEHCPHYQTVNAVVDILATEEVYSNRPDYTPKKCAQYAWALLGDTRSYFNPLNYKTTRDFRLSRMNLP